MPRARLPSGIVVLLLLLLAGEIDGKAVRRSVEKCKEMNLGYWDTWTPWSDCSRSCGGGVMRRTRQCLPDKKNCDDNEDDDKSETKRSTEVTQNKESAAAAACIDDGLNGLQYRSCNSTKCSKSTDFRAEQCVLFNSVAQSNESTPPLDLIPYYNHALNPCLLHCHDATQTTFTTFGTVIDGTRCHEDPLAPGVCAGGTCLETGCDGVIPVQGTKPKAYDVCGECGGNGQSCKTIKYEKIIDKCRGGSVDQFFYQLPAGARNVNITQKKLVKPVAVFLALKSADSDRYFINGVSGNESKIHFDGEISIQVAGTVFNYTSTRDENWKGQDTLSTRGVILEKLNVMLLILGQRTKYNISVTYALSGEPDESETTEVTNLSKCNTSASTGSKIPDAAVNQQEDKKPKQRKDYDKNSSDGNGESGNSPGEATWVRVGFRKCSQTCGGGTKKVKYECQVNGQEVHKRECADQRKTTVTKKTCNTDPCPPEWIAGPWSDENCTREVGCFHMVDGLHESIHPSLCIGKKPKAKKDCHSCKKTTGTWVATSCDECSNSCGEGITHCNVVCEGDCPCNPTGKAAASMRTCHEKTGCSVVRWYHEYPSSPTCGERKSVVKCYGTRDGEKRDLPHSMCNATEKPEPDVRQGMPCIGEWVIGEWEKCPKSCDSPQRRTRPILCMKGSAVLPAENCPILVEVATESCPNSCPACEDRAEINCKIACHYGLCLNSYYSSRCCTTCKSCRALQ